MTDFEVLKALVERDLRLKRRGRTDDESFTHYVMSISTGDDMKSVQITRENWNTPAAAWAMRLLLDAAIKRPVLKEFQQDSGEP